MGLRHFIFWIVIFGTMALGDAVWWRYTDRRLRRLPRATLWRTLLDVWMGWMIGYLLIMLALPFLMRTSHSPIPTPLHSAVYIWHLLVLPALLVAVGCYEVGKLIVGGLRGAGGSAQVAASTEGAPVKLEPASLSRPSRRDFMQIAVAAAAPPIVASGVVAYASHQLAAPPRVRRIELPLATLPAALEGMTIAHVTDMHVGKFTRDWTLPRLADQVNNLRADFVAVTGDLIDMSMSDLPAALDFLNRLDPRRGSLVCEGNHDLIDDPDGFEAAMRKCGHPFLADSAHVANFRGYPLQFLGIRWGKGSDTAPASLQRVLPSVEPEAFPILLAHHPHAFDPAASAKIPLTLSGHTHGGQLMLTKNVGAGSLFYKYWSGVYRHNDSALVVSNGVGAWFPLRVNAPAEIIHLTLRRA